MPRAKADATKPRGRVNAYAFFVKSARADEELKHPGEKVVFSEFSRECADRWKTMNDKEKKRFQEMAEKDKVRFDAEKKHHDIMEPKGGRGTKRKPMKDPNAPKRPLSGFFLFSHDERGRVKAEHNEYSVGEIAKELGKRWGELDPAMKLKYEQMFEKDKLRYEREMSAYKMQGQRAAAAAAAAGDDDDDEDEDDF